MLLKKGFAVQELMLREFILSCLALSFGQKKAILHESAYETWSSVAKDIPSFLYFRNFACRILIYIQ